MEDTTTYVTCNRVPFQSDENCDRGSVDITAFEDFPFCKVLTPTVSETGIPQEDFPVIPFSPPPCSCINVSVANRGVNISQGSKASLNVGFKSNGDCCNGNYIADVGMDLPCMPFDVSGGGGSSGKGNVNISTVCSDSASGSMSVGLTKKGCNLGISSSLTLRIPKPTSITAGMNLNVIAGNCQSAPTGSGSTQVSGSACSKHIQTNLTLTIPTPPKISVSSGSVSISGYNGASGSISGISGGGCSFNISPSIDLKIPCPISGSLQATVKLGWATAGTTSITRTLATGSNCSLTPANPTFDLKMPCPIAKGDQLKTQVSFKWITGIPAVTPQDILTNNGECGIKGGNLEIVAPCPIPEKIEAEVNVSLTPSVAGTQNVTLLERQDECTLGAPGGIDLQVPCPDYQITGGNGIKVTQNGDACSRSWKIDYTGSASCSGNIDVVTGIDFAWYGGQLLALLSRARIYNGCFSVRTLSSDTATLLSTYCKSVVVSSRYNGCEFKNTTVTVPVLSQALGSCGYESETTVFTAKSWSANL